MNTGAAERNRQVLLIMVAFGTWGLAHRDGERRLRVRAELLRDGGPDLTAAMMDELRELHLGRPRLDAGAPRASEQLRAAYDAAMRDDTGKPPTSPQPWRSRNRAGEHGDRGWARSGRWRSRVRDRRL